MWWRYGGSVWESLQRLNWLDALDIAIVAVLMYAALVWFRRTTTRLVVTGIIMLAGIYVLAKYFGLFLTTAIFQAFFAVLLIALIVIFQEELRQFFERLAVLGLERRTRPRTAELKIPIGIVLRTAANLARQRIGALIVLRGCDPLGRYLEGGKPLHGEPSEALFESLFDPHSPGHDGAVVIDGARVDGFAYRLPLSKDLQQTAPFGTRHAAALGIAERTDACCIVVSEERGGLSAAVDGQLHTALSLEELARRIERFYDDRFPVRQHGGWPRWVREHTREKVIAVILALGLWVAFAHQTELVRRDVTVPIEFRNLAPSLVILEPRPKTVTVTLSGEGRAFQWLDTSALRVSLDVSRVTTGRQVLQLSPKSLRPVPNELAVIRMEPEEITLRVSSAAHAP